MNCFIVCCLTIFSHINLYRKKQGKSKAQTNMHMGVKEDKKEKRGNKHGYFAFIIDINGDCFLFSVLPKLQPI